MSNSEMPHSHSGPLICPLCGHENVFVAKRFSSTPLVRYWNAFGYDVEKVFPQLREGLSKWQCVDCDLRFFTPQAVGGPDLYRALGRNAVYYAGAKWEFAHVLRRLARRPNGGTLLELGCGPGHFLERAAPYYERVVGLDFNDDAVREGRARGLDVRACDADELNETFDTIAAFQLIEHVPKPAETFRHLVKLLRPGGELIVAVPNEDSLLGALEQNSLNMPPHHASCWSKQALQSAARLHSLEFVDYACEPLSLDLYLGALHERFDRYLAGGNALMRPWLWLIRRNAVARALLEFDLVRKQEVGHTHIAFFRKAAA
jgi:SAM-dependent methyltransferase